jgi:hypothetical protein
VKAKQVLIGGDSPPALLAMGEDGSIWILEATINDTARARAGSGIFGQAPFGQGQHINYSWRRLPDLPDATEDGGGK